MTTHSIAEEAKFISSSPVKNCILFLLVSRSVKVKEASSTCCLHYYREFGITLPAVFIQVPQITNSPLGQKRTPAVSAKPCLTLFKNILFSLIRSHRNQNLQHKHGDDYKVLNLNDPAETIAAQTSWVLVKRPRKCILCRQP